jgi:hypothetical protein
VPAAPAPEEKRIEEEMHITPQQRAEAVTAPTAKESGQKDAPSDVGPAQEQQEPTESAAAQEGTIAIAKVSVQQTVGVAAAAVLKTASAAAKPVQSKAAGEDERWPMDGTPNVLAKPQVRAPCC